MDNMREIGIVISIGLSHPRSRVRDKERAIKAAIQAERAGAGK
jgi:hypothetical protein